MHVAHLLLVEAESHEEALDKVRSHIENDEYRTPDWSDWHEIGGRWDGTFKGKNVLRYTENTKLFEEKLQEWLGFRVAEMKRMAEEIKELDLSKMAEDYDPEAPHSYNEASMKVWYINRLSDLLQDHWVSDTYVYDLENFTGRMKSFRERVAVAPEMQYAVIVDFHH